MSVWSVAWVLRKLETKQVIYFNHYKAQARTYGETQLAVATRGWIALWKRDIHWFDQSQAGWVYGNRSTISPRASTKGGLTNMWSCNHPLVGKTHHVVLVYFEQFEIKNPYAFAIPGQTTFLNEMICFLFVDILYSEKYCMWSLGPAGIPPVLVPCVRRWNGRWRRSELAVLPGHWWVKLIQWFFWWRFRVRWWHIQFWRWQGCHVTYKVLSAKCMYAIWVQQIVVQVSSIVRSKLQTTNDATSQYQGKKKKKKARKGSKEKDSKKGKNDKKKKSKSNKKKGKKEDKEKTPEEIEKEEKKKIAANAGKVHRLLFSKPVEPSLLWSTNSRFWNHAILVPWWDSECFIFSCRTTQHSVPWPSPPCQVVKQAKGKLDSRGALLKKLEDAHDPQYQSGFYHQHFHTTAPTEGYTPM